MSKNLSMITITILISIFGHLVIIPYGVDGALALGPATVHPNEPEKCFDSTGTSGYHRPGESWKLDYCGQATCFVANYTGTPELMVSYASCGSIHAEPPCYIVENPSLNYPDCCPQPVCPEGFEPAESSAEEPEADDDDSESMMMKSENYEKRGEQEGQQYVNRGQPEMEIVSNNRMRKNEKPVPHHVQHEMKEDDDEFENEIEGSNHHFSDFPYYSMLQRFNVERRQNNQHGMDLMVKDERKQKKVNQKTHEETENDDAYYKMPVETFILPHLFPQFSDYYYHNEDDTTINNGNENNRKFSPRFHYMEPSFPHLSSYQWF